MPEVSVVTPFYNTAKYLRECIESVLAQTYSDFEYILADNCSSDGSEDIAKEYAAQDSRIRYVRFEELVPQVPNYNRALGLISPESRYCKIVQADDWIFPTCLQEMVKIADVNPNVGIVSAYEMLGDTVYQTGLTYSEQVLSGREVCRRSFLEDLFVFGSPNTVMYRAEHVRLRQPFYALNSPTEDIDAAIEILLKSDFAFVHQVLTFTRRDNVSIWSGINAMDPVPMHRLVVLVRYGREVLSEEEYRSALRRAKAAHGEALAKGVLGLKGRSFWQYQRQGLASAGLHLEPLSVAWHTALFVAKRVLNPLDTAQSVLARLKRSRPGD
ncbi:MAG: glycosyltransferase family 2 protein [Steroidobacteraceae bacterium]|nr:glycosyltransferase family 2 protein [Steroidobacteraceae bacterium]